jgi:hypothetical protein
MSDTTSDPAIMEAAIQDERLRQDPTSIDATEILNSGKNAMKKKVYVQKVK